MELNDKLDVMEFNKMQNDLILLSTDREVSTPNRTNLANPKSATLILISSGKGHLTSGSKAKSKF